MVHRKKAAQPAMQKPEPRRKPPRPARASQAGFQSLPDATLLWKTLTDSIDCFVAVLDPDLRIRFLNHSHAGHLPPSQLVGRKMEEFIVPEQREQVERMLREVLSSGRDAVSEVMGLDTSGTTASYSIRASAVADRGTFVALVVTAMDARQLHDSERALRAERHALQQMLRTQEKERQLVSYEIHDGLAQYQAGAIMQLEACLHGLEMRQDAQLDSVVRSCAEGLRLMRAAAAEARRLINGLRPPMLDELGIEEAVESLVERMRGVVPAIEFVRPHPLPRLDPDVETAVFRIIQESLSNIRKHAAARTVRVVAEKRGAGDIGIVVSDDGAGFDPQSVPTGRFGLEGIRQRARLFGREATITSAPGKGTRIEVTLPFFPAIMRGADPV